jgi:hypothetical protein
MTRVETFQQLHHRAGSCRAAVTARFEASLAHR